MNIYTIHDVKAKAFLQPFFSRNENTSIREMSKVVNNPGSFISENPEDFSLYKIGVYDELSGKIIPCDPTHVVNCISLLVVDDRQLHLPETPTLEGSKIDSKSDSENTTSSMENG